MKINEVLEKLGISRATLTRYRKKLGIFEETRIENFQLEINKVINDGELPDKYLLDGMEKYQKLNMQIMSTIEKQSPQGDSLKEMIQEKLARYG